MAKKSVKKPKRRRNREPFRARSRAGGRPDFVQRSDRPGGLSR